MWLKKNYLIGMFNSFLTDLARPKNLLWWWNFGFILGIIIVVQVVSGFMLALYYNDSINYAFYAVEYIINDINNGYLFRFVHSTGARMLFFLIFIHIGRNFWYKSYYIVSVWLVGVLIFALMIAVSFLGYVLPWGQMSFWAATVITNLLYVIPYLGGTILEWVWGGFSVGGPTLSRFFILHYILPFVILLLSVVHLIFLHEKGRSNPLGLYSGNDKIEFYPYFFLKDLVSFIFIIFILISFLLLLPYVFMDSENFLFMNSMKTPEHIKPEWYFLFAYCILRRVPNKVGGVIGLAIRIGILFLLPFLTSKNYKFINNNVFTVLFYLSFIMLTWLGGCVVEWPFNYLGIFFRVMYFVLIL